MFIILDYSEVLTSGENALCRLITKSFCGLSGTGVGYVIKCRPSYQLHLHSLSQSTLQEGVSEVFTGVIFEAAAVDVEPAPLNINGDFT